MRAALMITAVCAAALIGSSARADDAMSSSSMMDGDAMMSNDAMGSDTMGPDAMMMTTTTGGEVVAIMPDGHLGTSMMTGNKMQMTINMSSALDHCVMFITGVDGKVYQVDTSSAAAQAECEGIAK